VVLLEDRTVPDCAVCYRESLVRIGIIGAGQIGTTVAMALDRGRIVIDATNYFAERDGASPGIDQDSTTSSETIEDYFDDVRVVKTMNTLNYLPLGQRGVPAGTEGRLALPYAGNDPAAKAVVAGLLDDMGFDTIDTGSLKSGARWQQPGSPLFNRVLTAAQIRTELDQLDHNIGHRRAPDSALRIGAVFPQNEVGNDPGAIRAWAQTVEQLGYSHILAYDHVLGAGTSTRPGWSGYTSETSFHEVFVLFGYLAGVTTSVEFVTGVLVLPQRQTALVAKQAAEVDVLSGGRLRLGVGVGWNKVEYDGLAEPFHDRGARADEQVEVLRRLWTEPTITFEETDGSRRVHPMPTPAR
jgi:Luciferase-like monooxygenase